MLNKVDNVYICDKCLDEKEKHNTPGCVLCESRETFRLLGTHGVSLRDILLNSRSEINPMPWTKGKSN